MMGHQASGQERLFYAFNLEDVVPPTHLLRAIDRCLDLKELHQHLAKHYSHTGRPSIDPELMIRMLIVGYCYGIRSERRLCEEVQLNLAYRWFCRLGLEDAVPDHSTFSKNRHGRFRASDTFRWLFDEVVRRCMAAGLVKGEGFAVDASVVAADANRQRGVPASEATDWSNPALSTRAVREYLEALDDEAFEQAVPRRISLTDPQSRWTAAPGGPAFFAYSTNYLIDTEHGVILDVEATPAHRTAEVDSTKTMVDRVEERFDIIPDRLIGDTAYGTAPMLAWMVQDKGIEPHVPVWDRTQRKDDSLSSSDFEWDGEANEYRCPEGHALRSERRMFKIERTHVTKAGTVIYRASKTDCGKCAMKSQCCPNTPMRKIARSIHEDARDAARRIGATVQYQRSRHERKKVEVLFAHLKRILKIDRLRLRGLTGAADEFTLAAAVQNLRRLAMLTSPGPPIQGTGAPS
ncbi:transposase [Achromobacter xylosoxidans]|uniref:transposase n=1 Tax=unclassified Achromobacter TaxID=2626865 RepID=UPI000CFB73D8|nr:MULTISPECIES: transposase [unclassified Achromobacter]MBB1625969.1 transposase [Achromobacter sp. UMC71]PQZ54061.1 IS5/IS1182 family transposase [Achromobacter sp. MYb9]